LFQLLFLAIRDTRPFDNIVYSKIHQNV